MNQTGFTAKNISMFITGMLCIVGLATYSQTVSAAESMQNTSALENNWGNNNKVSPNPYMMRLYDNNGSYAISTFNPPGRKNHSTKTGYKHILKNSRTTYINEIEMYVYFSNTNPSNKTIKIEAPVDGSGWCDFDSTGNRKLEVYASQYGGNNSVRKFSGNANAGGSSSTCDAFKNKSFTLQANQISKDDTTGLYAAKIKFELTGQRVYSNARNQVSFSVKAPGALYVGSKGDRNSKNFGVQEDPNYGTAQYGFKLGIPFGVPCDGPATLANRPVKIFDGDRDSFGNTYFFILKRAIGSNTAVRLAKNEYNQSTRTNANWQSRNGNTNASTDRGWFLSTPISTDTNRTSSVEIAEMDRNYQYMLVVSNPYQRGDFIPGVGTVTSSPVGNVMSISVPTDTATGEVTCAPPPPPPGGGGNLQPNVSINRSTYPYYSQLTTGFGNVSGVRPESDRNYPWELYSVQYNVTPGSIAGSRSTDDNPCDGSGDSMPGGRIPYVAGGPTSCRYVNGGSYNGTTSTRSGTTFKSGPDALGTRTCYITRVQVNPPDPSPPAPAPGDPPYVPPTPNWEYSAFACAVAGKDPRFQVRGHDLRVGGGIVAKTTNMQSRYYGSWSEYGSLSGGANVDGQFASGGRLWQGSTSAPSVSNLNELTFANTDGDTGNFDAIGVAPVSQYVDKDANKVPGGPNFTIGATTYPDGARITRYYPGTLTITNNLQYGESYNSIRKIPRVILMADNIIIGPDVTRIDPWLIATREAGDLATGNLSTCDIGDNTANFRYADGTLDASDCNNQITFNGPVIADNIYLHRTHGAGPGATGTNEEKNRNRDSPAEVFALRPDVFLSSSVGDLTNKPVATTDRIVEVPPRF